METIVCQWLASCQWFSLGTPVSPTNKGHRHDIAKILLKVALHHKPTRQDQLEIINIIYVKP
jgi:hypothetical protein